MGVVDWWAVGPASGLSEDHREQRPPLSWFARFPCPSASYTLDTRGQQPMS